MVTEINLRHLNLRFKPIEEIEFILISTIALVLEYQKKMVSAFKKISRKIKTSVEMSKIRSN